MKNSLETIFSDSTAGWLQIACGSLDRFVPYIYLYCERIFLINCLCMSFFFLAKFH